MFWLWLFVGLVLQPIQLDIWSDLYVLLVVRDEALERFYPAVHKVARNDLLIAMQLDLVRDCCVLEMMLRDRAKGTNHHREGGVGNRFVAGFGSFQQPPTALGILRTIEKSSVLLDKLTAHRSDAYRQRRHTLLSWIGWARETVLQ